MEFAIEVQGLEKKFVKKRSVRELVTHPFRRAKRMHALRGVDFQVPPGEVFGLLGPNGAGKTTLLKILSCLVLPDRGEAKVLGDRTEDERKVKPKIGLVQSDERSFYWRLTGRENLRFFAALYDVPRERRDARIDELLRKVDMHRDADRRFSDYSLGMKQRMSIARALLHDPPILFMDEPTRSLDPASAMSLRRFIQEELSGRDSKTIILATHNLTEAASLCDRVAILARGKIREIGMVDEIRCWGMRERRFRLEVTDWRDDLDGPFRILENEILDGSARRRLLVSMDSGAGLHDLIAPLFTSGVKVHACDRVNPDLEDAFTRILAADVEDGA